MRPSMIVWAVVPLFFGCELMSLSYLQSGSRGTDGGREPDADAQTACQADASPCCTATHTFCDDFDHVDAASQGWNGGQVGPEGGATIVVDLDSAVDPPSPPGTLQVGSAADASSQAFLQQTFPGPIQSLHCEFDLRFDDNPTLPQFLSVVALRVAYPPENPTVSVELWTVNGDGVPPYIQTCAPETTCPQAPLNIQTPGAWRHVVYDLPHVVLGDAVISYGDSGPVDSYQYALPGYDGGIVVSLGDVQTVTGPLELHFDNFWCNTNQE
jgi:hypothetical protein